MVHSYKNPSAPKQPNVCVSNTWLSFNLDVENGNTQHAREPRQLSKAAAMQFTGCQSVQPVMIQHRSPTSAVQNLSYRGPSVVCWHSCDKYTADLWSIITPEWSTVKTRITALWLYTSADQSSCILHPSILFADHFHVTLKLTFDLLDTNWSSLHYFIHN